MGYEIIESDVEGEWLAFPTSLETGGLQEAKLPDGILAKVNKQFILFDILRREPDGTLVLVILDDDGKVFKG